VSSVHKILYYYWEELIAASAQEGFKKAGVEIAVISPKRTKYDYDLEFMAAIKNALVDEDGQPCFDAIFSFNFFPDLSRVAMECRVQYISWVYDSPHLTLQSLAVSNSCNRVFLFDYYQYVKYAEEGLATVEYLPLPARIIEKYESEDETCKYLHEISFVGNLYDREQDQYGSIGNLPEYIKGYLDSLICAQQYIYGEDLFSKLVTDDIFEKISEAVSIGLGSNYRNCGAEILRDMLRRRVTMNERTEVLSRLGKEYGSENVDLYCGIAHPELPVSNKGFAEYVKEMPEIFQTSKINLNITLRSIQTGIPLRVMDILGAGGFCITNYQPEIAEYFENGVDLVWYESIDDLLEKCRYYLAHDNERENIARNGQIKVKELFGFDKQILKIFG